MIIYVLQYTAYSVSKSKVVVIRSKYNEIKWNVKNPDAQD